MNLRKNNFYGLLHDKVAEKFSGDLSFVNDFCIKDSKGNYGTAAVYHAKNPDRSKGHKEYMLLFNSYNPISDSAQWFVAGRTPEEMEKDRWVSGVWCKGCDEVLYSAHRHDMVTCRCKNAAFADGGRDYLRSGARDLNLLKIVKIDLLTDKIVVLRPKTKRKTDGTKSKRKASPVNGRRKVATKKRSSR